MGECGLQSWKSLNGKQKEACPSAWKKKGIGIAYLLCVRHCKMFPCSVSSFPRSCEIDGIKPTLQSLGLEGCNDLTEADPARSNLWDLSWRCLALEPLCILPCILPRGWVTASVAACLCFHGLLQRETKGRDDGRVRLREHLEVDSSPWAFPSRPLGDHEDACGWHHSDPQGLPTPGGQDHRGGQEAGLPGDHHARFSFPLGGAGGGLASVIHFLFKKSTTSFLLLFSISLSEGNHWKQLLYIQKSSMHSHNKHKHINIHTCTHAPTNGSHTLYTITYYTLHSVLQLTSHLIIYHGHPFHFTTRGIISLLLGWILTFSEIAKVFFLLPKESTLIVKCPNGMKRFKVKP